MDQRFTEAQVESQAIRKLTHERFESMTKTVTSVANEAVQRLEVINRIVEEDAATSNAPTGRRTTPSSLMDKRAIHSLAPANHWSGFEAV